MKHVVCSVCMMFVLLGVASGQDRETAGRQQPSSRPVDVRPPQEQSQLPKIDLPEFVITGSESIDPPEVHKDTLNESGLYRRNPLENQPGGRDVGTIDLGDRFKQSLFATDEVHSGMIMGSLGTFFSPRVMASYGISSITEGILGSASYRRTKGFARYTDASRAEIELIGNLIVQSTNAFLDRARVEGAAAYDIQKYKFYGSDAPSTQRTRSVWRAGLGANPGVDAPLQLRAGLEYRSLSVVDSTTTATENHVTISGGGLLPVFSENLEFSANVDLATVTTSKAFPISLIRLGLASPLWKWNDFSVQAALNGYSVKGMEGQGSAYLYPTISVTHLLHAHHMASLAFAPSVSLATLRDQTVRFPYLSAGSTLRHRIDRLSFTGAIESEWSARVRTKASFAFRTSTDEPLYRDSSDSGIGLLMYGGTTSVSEVRLDAVANITANDYFGIAITARTSRNDLTGAEVPYLPGFDFSATYRHRFPGDIQLSARFNVLGGRRSTADAARTVPAGLWSGITAEYTGLQRLTVFLNIENLLNRRDEVWRGYGVEPLRAELGVSYRW